MAEPTPNIDSVSKSAPAAPKAVPQTQQQNVAGTAPAKNSTILTWKMIIIGMIGFGYMVYVFWCLFLIASLPSIEASQNLVLAGFISCGVAAVILVAAGIALFMRIAQAQAGMRARQIAIIKLALTVLPGLALSIATPLLIMGEPALPIDIIQPTSTDEIVAPLPITFSVERILPALARRGFRPVQYRWDMDGDRKSDQETLEPIATRNFDREGIYDVYVSLISSTGEAKTARINFIIRQSVFSIAPNPPVVDRPVVFSVAHLIEDRKQVKSIAWDFNGDGSPDEEGTALQTSFTYLNTGRVQVGATITLQNDTQASYERIISVENPEPLPFLVTVASLPSTLIGTAPFSALFTVETEEPVHSVLWNFGDGKRGEGERALHTFDNIGVYNVHAAVRSMTGIISNVYTVTRVVERLDLPDLTITADPPLQNATVRGEAPLSIELEASTTNQFVEFSWEAEEVTDIAQREGDTLQAIYRRPGTYTVTLVAQDLQNRVLRRPITIVVEPPSSIVVIRMEEETGTAPFMARFDASESAIPGEDITGFVWDFGDRSPEEVGGAVTQHLYRTPGTYTVTLTAQTASGRQESATKNVIVRAPTIQPRIFASRLSGSAPLTVEFDGSSTTGAPVSYLWDFGDGSQTDGETALHTFTSPGQYTVSLTVTDSSGIAATTSISITVQ